MGATPLLWHESSPEPIGMSEGEELGRGTGFAKLSCCISAPVEVAIQCICCWTGKNDPLFFLNVKVFFPLIEKSHVRCIFIYNDDM